MNNCAFSNYLTSVMTRGLACEVYPVWKNISDTSLWVLILVSWIHVWWKHVLMEMQIKITIRSHFTPNRVAGGRGGRVSLCWWGHNTERTLIRAGGIVHWCVHFGNHFILCSKAECLNTLQPSISLPRCIPYEDSCICTLGNTQEYSRQCSS